MHLLLNAVHPSVGAAESDGLGLSRAWASGVPPSSSGSRPSDRRGKHRTDLPSEVAYAGTRLSIAAAPPRPGISAVGDVSECRVWTLDDDVPDCRSTIWAISSPRGFRVNRLGERSSGKRTYCTSSPCLTRFRFVDGTTAPSPRHTFTMPTSRRIRNDPHTNFDVTIPKNLNGPPARARHL